MRKAQPDVRRAAIRLKPLESHEPASGRDQESERMVMNIVGRHAQVRRVAGVAALISGDTISIDVDFMLDRTFPWAPCTPRRRT